MGLFGGILGTLTDPLDLAGQRSGDAADRAADSQIEATDLGIAEQRQAREQSREDLAPFRDEGAGALPGLSNLINNPDAKKDFVTKNDFFKFLNDESQSRLFSSVGGGPAGASGALDNNLLTLGNQLISKNINQRFNVAALGSNAAAKQGTATLGTGRSISDLTTQGGNAAAAGIIGAQNAQTTGRQGLASAGIGIAGIFLSDRRIKENIEEVGKMNNGLPIYIFNYIGNPKMLMSVMAQDVQEVLPDAVIEIDGVLHVDMEKVSNGY